jgi:hypothetical protein
MVGIKLQTRGTMLLLKIPEFIPFERFSITTNNSDIKLSSWVISKRMNIVLTF